MARGYDPIYMGRGYDYGHFQLKDPNDQVLIKGMTSSSAFIHTQTTSVYHSKQSGYRENRTHNNQKNSRNQRTSREHSSHPRSVGRDTAQKKPYSTHGQDRPRFQKKSRNDSTFSHSPSPPHQLPAYQPSRPLVHVQPLPKSARGHIFKLHEMVEVVEDYDVDGSHSGKKYRVEADPQPGDPEIMLWNPFTGDHFSCAVKKLEWTGFMWEDYEPLMNKSHSTLNNNVSPVVTSSTIVPVVHPYPSLLNPSSLNPSSLNPSSLNPPIQPTTPPSFAILPTLPSDSLAQPMPKTMSKTMPKTLLDTLKDIAPFLTSSSTSAALSSSSTSAALSSISSSSSAIYYPDPRLSPPHPSLSSFPSSSFHHRTDIIPRSRSRSRSPPRERLSELTLQPHNHKHRAHYRSRSRSRSSSLSSTPSIYADRDNRPFSRKRQQRQQQKQNKSKRDAERLLTSALASTLSSSFSSSQGPKEKEGPKEKPKVSSNIQPVEKKIEPVINKPIVEKQKTKQKNHHNKEQLGLSKRLWAGKERDTQTILFNLTDEQYQQVSKLYTDVYSYDPTDSSYGNASNVNIWRKLYADRKVSQVLMLDPQFDQLLLPSLPQWDKQTRDKLANELKSFETMAFRMKKNDTLLLTFQLVKDMFDLIPTPSPPQSKPLLPHPPPPPPPSEEWVPILPLFPPANTLGRKDVF